MWAVTFPCEHSPMLSCFRRAREAKQKERPKECVAAQTEQEEDEVVVTVVVVVVVEEEDVMIRQARPPARQGRWVLLSLPELRKPRRG